ncbi:SH3 domain-containing protein [Streptomyces sp. H39-S7]|uniref:SH3 domain-containing protein n=1 Tax=Streptomyces sp. H39-S7 TaxID=3004357 RepID=UPI0022AEA314|nr:SH3 domain-containing protein [Streptomyces sp. H39-S7]MCZ4121950.1 SH3 domain-containing protein [Streptomyces sp. H39-S7]
MAAGITFKGTKRKAVLALATTGLALASSLAVATPSQAAATVSCSGWNHSNKDSGSGSSTGTYALKSGPYAACSYSGQTYNGTYLYYHCYTVNEYGNTWTWARIAGTGTEGWMSDANLTLNPDGFTRGATQHC